MNPIKTLNQGAVKTDPSHDIFRDRSHPLDAIFKPRNVAVIGATDKAGSVGRTVLWNLVQNPFGGTVYPVTPTHKSVLGIKAYPSIDRVPEDVDLAVIVTPSKVVPSVVDECVAAGVKGAIIISAGFKETGKDGEALERQILAKAKGKMRIVGPNCLGVMNPMGGINATFAAKMAKPGNVAFLSQSGALCTAVLDWSFQEMVGFSAFVSLGSMLDVGWGDLIDYLGDDPNTQSIILYMESIGDARSFLSAAREVALNKPIIIIKAGRTEAAAKAAASHTGAMVGSDDVLDAAFRRCGILRVDRISDLFYTAEILSKQPRPRGRRLAVLTNAGGPGVLASDALLGAGGELADVSKDTLGALNAILPAHWSHGNPVDILGDAQPERYAQAVDLLAKDPANDGLLVILTPQAMTDPKKTAKQVAAYAKLGNKPLIASWMGGPDVNEGRQILSKAGIPMFDFPDTAARMFDYMWRYSENLRMLYETPSQSARDMEKSSPERLQAVALIKEAREAGRTLLTEWESKAVLAGWGIPVVRTEFAATADDAVKLADAISYPVVLKLASKTITHKTDVGGVRLHLQDAKAVREAYEGIRKAVLTKMGPGHFEGVTVQPHVARDGYEIILGSSVDAQFGPVLLFGTGGQWVEVMKDRALGLPPLTSTLARRLMERTKIHQALKGIRGSGPANLALLEEIMVYFSYLVIEEPWIKEIDINPLLVSEKQIIALDARILLHDAATKESALPKPAICPYPSQYRFAWKIKGDGKEQAVTIRPIRPEDEPLMAQFHKMLSERSVGLRFFQPLKLDQRIAHERLLRRCFTDYEREIALVAEKKGEILGVARMTKIPGTQDAEFAILVADTYQRKGLGTEMMHRLLEVGRREGVRRIVADVLPENTDMQRICAKLGFCITHAQSGWVKAVMTL